MEAFRGKAFEVTDEVRETLTALEQDIANGDSLQDVISAIDISDSNLKEFLAHASEQNITPTTEAYKDWATNVKGLGKQFDIAKVKAIALNMAASIGISLAIQAAVKLYTYLFNIQDELDKKVTDLTDNLGSLTDGIKSNEDEVDKLNKKLSDNADRYDELIKKKQESNLTSEENNELKQLQDINAELLNQKNILEENTALKREEAAKTAQELAELLIRQEEISVAMEENYGKILKLISTYGMKVILPIAKPVEVLAEILHKIGWLSDDLYEKVKNLTSGTAVMSWIVQADVTQQSSKSLEENFKKARDEVDKLRQKYGGTIDANTKMSHDDAEYLKQQKELLLEYAKEAEPIYNQLNSAIKSIEASPESAAVSSNELDKLKTMRDTYGEILSYSKDVFKTASDINEATDEGSSISSKNQKKLDEIAKSEALTKLKYKFDQIEQSINKVNNAISLLDNTLDLTSDEDYLTKLDITNRKLGLVQQKAALLRDEFVQLSTQEYDSADSANELATRMKSVADSIAENNKDIINYSKNIAEYYTSALTSVSSLSKATIDEATNLLDRNIKALSDGGLVGLSFNLSPTIPKSALDKQREQNRSMEAEMQSYYDTVAQMQKTALDLEYKEQMESYAEQRAELDGTLTKSKETIKKSAEETLGETKDYSDKTQTVVTDLNNWMTKNPLTAPSLDTSKWEGLVKNAENYAKRIQDVFSGSLVNPTATFINGNDAGSKAANLAQQFLGTPYEWGGTTPSGFDCSGLVQYVYKQLGYNIGRTTYDQIKEGKEVSKSNLKAGDLVFFGTSNNPHHVGMYIGNGQYIQAPQTGDVVKISSLEDRNDYVSARRIATYAKGTKPFNYDGIAGENYKPELLIDKKTGEITRIDSPTPIDTSKVDVMGEEDTARLEKHKYANGTLSDYTSTNLGSLDIVKELPKLTVEQIQYLLRTKFGNSSVVKESDAQGIYNAQVSSGISALAILGIGAQESGWGKYPIGNNIWGYGATNDNPSGNAHKYSNMSQGASEFANEFLKDYYNGYGLKSISAIGSGGGNGNIAYAQDGNGNALSSWSTGISSIMSDMVKSLSSNGLNDIANNVSSIASDTSKIASVDFKTQLRNLLDDKSVSANQTQYQGDLLSYIKENAQIQQNNTDELLSSFDKLQTYQNSQVERFKGYEQQLLDSVGTSDFASLREEISKATTDYTSTMMKESTDITVNGIKDTFDQAKDIQDTILQYFYKRRDEGANADELKTIMEAYSTQDEIVQELSDRYVSAIASYTDYVVAIAEREMKSYNDRISWNEKINSDLERQLGRTGNSKEKSNIINQMISNNDDMISTYQSQKDAAHQGVLDLYKNKNYTPIFQQFDLETWFDANGELTAQYENDLARMAITAPELVPVMKELSSQVGTYKRTWYEADDAIKDVRDSTQELADEQADLKLDTYIDKQERVAEIIDYQVEKQQKIIDAQEKANQVAKNLRDAQAEIDKELRANKDLAEWLDDDTRRWLFNEDDYAAESKAIQDIQSEMNTLTANYQKQMSQLSEQDWYQSETLTREYERQVDALNEKLDVAKQTLAVSKKQAEYDNRAKERDTQIILGNRVVNVADPEALYNLSREKADLETTLDNTKITNAENQNIRDLQKANDLTSQESAAIQNRIDMLNRMTPEEQRVFSGLLEPIEVLTAQLNAIKYEDPNYIIRNDNTNALVAEHATLDSGASLGISLDKDHSQGVYDLLGAVQNGILSLDDAQIYIDRLQEQHNYKTSTDPNNSGYKQYENATQYSENLLKQYDKEQGLLDNNAEYNKILSDIKDGKYVVVEPQDMALNAGDIVKLAQMGMSHDMLQDYMKQIVGLPTSTINNVQSTESNPSVHYQFNGDIILTEEISNGDEFLKSLSYKIGDIHPIIKNTKI